MKYSGFRLLAILLPLILVFNGCSTTNDNEDDITPDIKDVSILGVWQMYGNTKYGLEFTNYEIVIWKHLPYMGSSLNYTYDGTTLTVSDKKGTATFLDDGNTLKISGFSDPSSFGAEDATGPYINGTYIRQ